MRAASTVTATGRRAASRASASAMRSTPHDPDGHVVGQRLEAAHHHQVALSDSGAYLDLIVVTQSQLDSLLRYILLAQQEHYRPAAAIRDRGSRNNRHVLTTLADQRDLNKHSR